jgi:hypothetical protein
MLESVMTWNEPNLEADAGWERSAAMVRRCEPGGAIRPPSTDRPLASMAT